MTNNKQQSSVEWYDNEIVKLFDQYTMGKIKIYEFDNQRFKLQKQAKEMEIAGKEMSYADGYKEGYKRAMELVEWGITKKIKGNR